MRRTAPAFVGAARAILAPLLICIGLLWIGDLRAQEETQPPDNQTIKVDVNFVTLRFTVRDAGGGFVNDLPRDVFRVLQDGSPQDVVLFEQPRNKSGGGGRLLLAFLIDVSGSTFATRAEEIVAAQRFLENVTDATQVGIFGFTDKVIPFQTFTGDRNLAAKAFREARSHLGRTAIYDSLASVLSVINSKASPGDRKAVIIISDGLDDNYKLATAAAANARVSGATLYTILVPSAAQVYIGPSSTQNDGSYAVNELDKDREAKEAAFSQLSLRTGGKHYSGFEAILDFDDTLAQINDDLFGNLYTMAYYSDTLIAPSRLPNIDIQVARPSLRVSQPFTRLPGQLAAKKSLIAAFFNKVPSLDVPDDPTQQFEEIGAEMDVLSTRREGGKIGLPFRIKINPFTFRGATSNGVNTQLGVIGLLVDSQGKETVRLREIFRVDLGAKEIREGRGILYTNKLLAPPGSYELRVALLELATWRLTSFERSVRITEP